MAGLASLCLLLVLPVSSSQIHPSEQQVHVHPPRRLHIDLLGREGPHIGQQDLLGREGPHIGLRDLLKREETSHLHAKQTYAHVDKDNAKVCLFLTAAMGTIMLMAAVYCIYNRFYTKQQYLPTQLHDAAELTIVSMDDSPMSFRGSVASGVGDEQRAGYGSLSHSPSIISVPPSLSPPPSVLPFPPLFLSSHSLRTISAKDLEKSFV